MQRFSTRKIVQVYIPLLTAITLILLFCVSLAQAQSYQGFGATTYGGANGSVVHVTTLNDAGPGSLREALTGSHRTIVFDVAGEIVLQDFLYVSGAYITLDGFSAPSPGITIRNRGLIIRGNRGAHDIIVRGIRVRDASIDGIQIAYGAYNVVIDHVSVAGSGDGNIDITEGSYNVTVSWSLLAGTGKNMLIKYNPSRITLHHNLLTQNKTRNPQVRMDDAGTPATETTIDIRNNLIWEWDIGYGTLVWHGPWANIVRNYYSWADDALTVSAARAYVEGNMSADSLDLNQTGNEAVPFPAPEVDTQDACTAAHLVLAHAGVHPLDSRDQQYLSAITLPSCLDEPTSPGLTVHPTSLAFGVVATGTSDTQLVTIANSGMANLEVGTLVLDGMDTHLFSLHNDNCSEQSLPPLASCTFEVVFAPTSPGLKEATLTIASNDPALPTFDIALSGSGQTETLAERHHVKVYAAKPTRGMPQFTPREVFLADQFEAKHVTLLNPVSFGTPVRVNGEDHRNPTTQLTCYQTRDIGGQPKFTRQNVVVENQFGTQALTLAKPETLCIPSEPGEGSSLSSFDPVKCYAARSTRGTPRFASFEVFLDDQFEAKETTVLRPSAVCTPGDLNGEGLLEPTAHLTCYDIRDVRGQLPFTGQEILADNRFGTQSLTLSTPDTFCVPSTLRSLE